MIRFDKISWSSGSFRIDDLSLEIPSASYAVLMGRTGCGKTTIAEILCGLRNPSSGRVFLGGRDVSQLPPGLRGVGYVPQDGALFPTMTVRENLGFALRIRGVSSELVRQEVEPMAERLSVQNLLERRPENLSGGERQRVALGRALMSRPEVLVLDEPLSALDDDTREGLVSLLREIQSSLKITALHITHNMDEARHLADRIYKMERGTVCEV